jgi:transcriptional regulator with XRE-family HTH domain
MKAGAKVRKARKQALLTQAELAALAGVGITTIVRVERGQVEAHPHTLRLLARALDVRAVALVADDEPLARAEPAATYVTRSLSPDS